MSSAFIALGSNLPSPAGPPESTLAAAVERLASLGRIFARSSLYSTVPVGFADQPRFLNAVVALETSLAPRDLLAALLAIEHDFGRDRAAQVPNGPRTLDLDLLLYDSLILGEPGLEIPHPRLAERAFILVPLNEIAPSLRDPRSGLSIAELLRALPRGSAPGAVAKIESGLWTATISS
ncbi:MAG: 2-amino-4-hydroxy-6-hydroxymethyldihydropteridine diphosphokinase [Terracidiphilus sp.]